MERFFPLTHLCIEQLRDLFREASRVGRVVVVSDPFFRQDYYEMTLPETTILQQINPKRHNHLIYHKDFEGMPDGLTIGFPMDDPFTTAYVELDNAHLKEIATKYNRAFTSSSLSVSPTDRPAIAFQFSGSTLRFTDVSARCPSTVTRSNTGASPFFEILDFFT